jgi:transmembrane sensor
METLINMNEESKRINLINKFLIGKCSPEEEKELNDWINQSIDNKNYFDKFKYAWIASIQIKQVNFEDIEESIEKFQSRILPEFSDDTDTKKRYSLYHLKIFSNRIVRYAAIFFLAFLFGGLSQKFIGNEDHKIKISDNKYFYFESPKGSRSIAVLPDGTKVWLNASSKISYSLDYNKTERIILLEGEAFFDVATNHSKPFVVKANNLDIKAYGTLFNVKAYPEENQVITTLIEGKVTIEGIDDTNKKFALKMDPKQCIIFKTDKKADRSSEPEIREIPDKNIQDKLVDSSSLSVDLPVIKETLSEPEINTSWKDERWIIANEDLKSLSIMLERRFNVNIKFLDEESKKYHFTGIIENETIEQVLKILSLTFPVKFEINRNNIELVLNRELKNSYINALKSSSIEINPSKSN